MGKKNLTTLLLISIGFSNTGNALACLTSKWAKKILRRGNVFLFLKALLPVQETLKLRSSPCGAPEKHVQLCTKFPFRRGGSCCAWHIPCKCTPKSEVTSERQGITLIKSHNEKAEQLFSSIFIFLILPNIVPCNIKLLI